VRITVTPPAGQAGVWEEIDDLTAAGPEVPVEDLRLPPGIRTNPKRPAQVFALDAEAGVVRFGDGFRGMRPPDGATIRAEYDYSEGREGNVAEGFIKTAPALPAGIKVTNPVRTWCGADAETVPEGEKQISRWLQHRDRLVTAEDFETITLRTPGVDIGRVEVLPVFSPELPLDEPGNAAGAVTLMVIPKFDAISPDAPVPDPMFINAICDWLDSRRLMTTELFVRGPTYVPVWISVGINVVAGKSFAAVREAVEGHIRRFLAPSRTEDEALRLPQMPKGWPLRRAVVDIELMAEISRVPGVASVSKLYLAKGGEPQTANVPLRGLELPRIEGISVSPDQPVPLDEFRGKTAPPSGGPPAPRVVPVPVIPEEC
jgi:predicted phage baseplate assembly protein